jgi:lipoprotein-anchoring transpeptidase ErfK/SrfK
MIENENTEVLMRRSGRSSRILVAVLALGLAAGVFAAVNKIASNRQTVVQPLLAVGEMPKPQLGVTTTPAAPATRPVTLVSVPATRPAETVVRRPQEPATRPAALPPSARIALPAPATRPAETAAAGPLPLPLATARAKFEAGDLMAARALLNEALVLERLSAADTASARDLLKQINDQVIFSRKIFRGDTQVVSYTVQPGETLGKIAHRHQTTWELICRINGIADPRRVKANQTLKLIRGPVHAVVSKSGYTLDLYLGAPGGPGSMFITALPVGLGKDDSTPLGTWKVLNKLKNPTYYSPRGEGIIGADDPANPLGEYWLGLEGVDSSTADKASYGIHGTIEPDSIGKSESMGCIRLRDEDIRMVYEMLVAKESLVLVKE